MEGTSGQVLILGIFFPFSFFFNGFSNNLFNGILVLRSTTVHVDYMVIKSFKFLKLKF